MDKFVHVAGKGSVAQIFGQLTAQLFPDAEPDEPDEPAEPLEPVEPEDPVDPELPLIDEELLLGTHGAPSQCV